MRRTVLLAVLALAGCGGAGTKPLEPARPAAPQRVELGWRESYPAAGERLVFEVDGLEIRKEGWSVTVAVTNRTRIRFTLGDTPSDVGFGLMLFRTGDLAELEEAARAGGLPPVRRANTIEPRLPDALAPGETWRATLSAPGSLAGGSWLRVAFGPLAADGEPPEGMEPVVFWITDRAHRL